MPYLISDLMNSKHFNISLALVQNKCTQTYFLIKGKESYLVFISLKNYSHTYIFFQLAINM